MADVPANTRFGLVGLLLGLQSQDLSLVAETLVALGFLPDDLPAPKTSLAPSSPAAPSPSAAASAAPETAALPAVFARSDEASRWPAWAWPLDARYDLEPHADVEEGPLAAAADGAVAAAPKDAATSAALTVVLPALEEAFAAASSPAAGGLNFTRLSAELGALSAGPLPFRTPPFFALIVRTLAIYEGLAKQVDPTFVLLKVRGLSYALACAFCARTLLRDVRTDDKLTATLCIFVVVCFLNSFVIFMLHLPHALLGCVSVDRGRSLRLGRQPRAASPSPPLALGPTKRPHPVGSARTPLGRGRRHPIL